MKKKLIITAAVFCTLVVGTLIIARITGMLQFFSIPTPSNQPSINVGDKVYSSNLKDPAPYHFIVFTSPYADSVNMSYMPDFKAASRYIQRLCGVPGDSIEMKGGKLYVNNKNFDEKLNLNIEYKITTAEFYLIDEEDMNTGIASGQMQVISKDSAIVTFHNELVKKYASKIKPLPYIVPDNAFGAFKWNGKNENWTVDNFGPLKIPVDCYFVLGDNRHNALDSRYIGFIKKENIKGVALNK
jgi:signal peptidase I